MPGGWAGCLPPCALNLSPGKGNWNGGRISPRCLEGHELHLEELICTSLGTESLAVAKAMHMSHRCYRKITTHKFPGYFKRYNRGFT